MSQTRAAVPPEMRERLPATLEAAEAVCLRARGRLASYLAPRTLFAVELVLREALANAVLHGCAGRPEHIVVCEVLPAEDRVTLLVEHDGPGFDWRRALARPGSPRALSGRGLEIIQQYSSQLTFDDSGRQMTITCLLQQGGSD